MVAVTETSEATTPARGDRRARRAKGHAQRERIVAAAVELLAVRGFRGTTIAELAEQVGTTHTNLIYYFGSKERLLHEVVAERERQEDAEHRAALDSASFTGLNEIARLIVTNVRFTRLYVVLAAENLDEGDPLHDFFVRRYQRSREFVEIAIEKERGRGTILRDVDPAQMGREVLATLMGLEIQWLMDPDRVDLVASVDAYVHALQQRMAAP